MRNSPAELYKAMGGFATNGINMTKLESYQLGGKFIALEVGGSETVLNAGDRLAYTQGAIDIWSLVSQYMFDSGKGGNTEEAPNENAPDQPQGQPEGQPQ